MMTPLLGFFLLLCVGYSYQASIGSLQNPNDIPGFIFQYAITRGISVNHPGYRSNCLKDFKNKMFSKWESLGHMSKVKTVEDCDRACDDTINCKFFQLTTVVPYGVGCGVYNGIAYAQGTPLFSGDKNCPNKSCAVREHSYQRKYKIFPRRDLPDDGLPKHGLGGSFAECAKLCRGRSGKNGYTIDEINWSYTYKFLQDKNPDGIISCGHFTYYHILTVVGLCMIFEDSAQREKVTKIAGPTPICRKEREEELQRALNNPKFSDHIGKVFKQSQSVGYENRTINPEDCEAACRRNNKCKKFLTIIGMPHKSGCHMFPDNADTEMVKVQSGLGTCPVESPGCVKNDTAYGRTYQLVLRKEAQNQTGNGLKDCQEYCAAHSEEELGIKWKELDWYQSFSSQRVKHRYKCVSYTYVSSDWFGNKCMLFGEYAKLHKVLHKFGQT